MPNCGKTQSLHCLPSDPNVRKEWMNFIFNEVPDRVSKNSVLCSFHFTADLFTNKTQFDAGFSERLKLKDDAVPTLFDPTVIAKHTGVSNCFYYNCFDSLFDMYWVFTAFNLHHSSIHKNQGDSHFWVGLQKYFIPAALYNCYYHSAH